MFPRRLVTNSILSCIKSTHITNNLKGISTNLCSFSKSNVKSLVNVSHQSSQFQSIRFYAKGKDKKKDKGILLTVETVKLN